MGDGAAGVVAARSVELSFTPRQRDKKAGALLHSIELLLLIPGRFHCD